MSGRTAAKRLVGGLQKKAASLFFRYTARLSLPLPTAVVPVAVEPAKVHLFSLRRSSSVKSGRHEEEALLHGTAVRFDRSQLGMSFEQYVLVRRVESFIPRCSDDTALQCRPADVCTVSLSLNAHLRNCPVIHDRVTTTIVAASIQPANVSAVPSEIGSPGKPAVQSTLFLLDKEPRRFTRRAAFAISPLVCCVPGDVMARVPLVRYPEADLYMPTPPDSVWRVEKDLLAAAAGPNVAAEEIEIMGIFRRVPVDSASSIALLPQAAALHVFLRPPFGNRVQSRNQTVFSIAYGRVRGQKRVVRALIPEKVD